MIQIWVHPVKPMLWVIAVCLKELVLVCRLEHKTNLQRPFRIIGNSILRTLWRYIYRRIKWNNRGCKSTVLRCVIRVEKDGPDCPARTVHEELIHEVVVKAINQAFREKEDILPLLIENIESSP